MSADRSSSNREQIEALAYVVFALRSQEMQFRRGQGGLRPPAGVSQLVDEMGFRVTRGQSGSALADPVEPEESCSQVEVRAVRYETAARMLEVSVSTIKRLVADGVLPTVALGSASRIRVADLDESLAALKTTRKRAS